MQYLLTKEEYADLVSKDEVTRRNIALSAARDKLLQVSGFDCIHNKQGRNHGGYCSGCPCSPIAGGNEYKTWMLVCWLDQEFPQ